MSLQSRYFAPLLVVGGAAWIAVAPIAAADSVLPVAGSESASATIKDLKAQGYNVAINWVNGIPDVSLSQCWVNAINTADASSQNTLKTVYVDIECPK
jgi:predicted Zn-dependent protease